jgi:CDP-4-dehydro-6-deoxyglucose reductase, E3
MVTFAKPQKYKAEVVEKTQVAQTVFKARYRLVEPTTAEIVAGQTFMLTVASDTRRAMSITSPPQENTVITSFQNVAPGGPGSRWMLALKVGDPVELMAPLGRFCVDHESPRKKVFIATGTGIAPFRSMLLDTTDNRIPNEQMSLYWGLRSIEDIFNNEELERIDAERDNLKYYLTLSKPPEYWKGSVGHVTDLVFANEQDIPGCDYYLCGNRKMIVEMQTRLTEKGVHKEQMKFDPFF